MCLWFFKKQHTFESGPSRRRGSQVSLHVRSILFIGQPRLVYPRQVWKQAHASFFFKEIGSC
jgi:hypothetical protein